MSPYGGDKGNRTLDPLLAKQVLSQLSYTPMLSQSGFGCTFSLLSSLRFRRRAFRRRRFPAGPSKPNNIEWLAIPLYQTPLSPKLCVSA